MAMEETLSFSQLYSTPLVPHTWRGHSLHEHNRAADIAADMATFRSQNSTEHLRHCRRSIVAAALHVRGPRACPRHSSLLQSRHARGRLRGHARGQGHFVPIPELHGTSSKRAPRCGPMKQIKIRCNTPVLCVVKALFLPSTTLIPIPRITRTIPLDSCFGFLYIYAGSQDHHVDC